MPRRDAPPVLDADRAAGGLDRAVVADLGQRDAHVVAAHQRALGHVLKRRARLAAVRLDLAAFDQLRISVRLQELGDGLGIRLGRAALVAVNEGRVAALALEHARLTKRRRLLRQHSDFRLEHAVDAKRGGLHTLRFPAEGQLP